MKKHLLKSLLALALVLISGNALGADGDVTVTISYSDIPDGFTATTGTSGSLKKTVSSAEDLTINYSGINTKSSATAADHSYGYAMFLKNNGFAYSGDCPSGYYPSKVTVTFGSNTGESGKAGITFGSTVLSARNSAVTGAVTKSGTCENTNNEQTILYWNFSTTGANVQVDNIKVVYSKINNSKVATPTISPEGGEFLGSQTITLACSTTGAKMYYTLDGNDPTASSTEYTDPFTITETTTVKVIATKSGLSDSNVASATFTKKTPLDNIAALTSKTEAGTYFVTLSNAVVTYVNDKYAYIQDASGAVVYYNNDGHTLTAGDVLNGIASITYQLQKNNPQVTALTGVTPASGTAPAPTTLKASEWNYTFNDVLSQYFKITGATVTMNSNKYYISLGLETVQLYKSGTALSNLDLTKKYTITGFPTLYNSTKELQVFVDLEEEVSTNPSIAATPVSLTGFSYEVDKGPSVSKSFTVSGSNLSDDISLTAPSDYAVSFSENDGYTSSLTIVPTSGTVSGTIVYVRLKAGLDKGSHNGTITLSSTGADNVSVSLEGTVVAPSQTWDLSIDQTATATADEMTWTGKYASMAIAKGSATTDANNYYPGTQNYKSTRFYKNSNLTIIPANGFAISSVLFTATSEGYANALASSTWTNATATASSTTVTVTPTDGKAVISASIGGTCGFTAVTVYYEKITSLPVTISSAGWATLCLPFDALIPSGVTAYAITGVNGESLEMEELTDGIVADEGVLLKGTEGTVTNVTFTEEIGKFNFPSDNLLIGTTKAGGETFDDGGLGGTSFYILANDPTDGIGFYYQVDGGASATCDQYKAVLRLASKTPAIGFRLDGATKIDAVPAAAEDVVIYDLTGRRVENATRGIYIVNGKKMLVK